MKYSWFSFVIDYVLFKTRVRVFYVICKTQVSVLEVIFSNSLIIHEENSAAPRIFNQLVCI